MKYFSTFVLSKHKLSRGCWPEMNC